MYTKLAREKVENVRACAYRLLGANSIRAVSSRSHKSHDLNHRTNFWFYGIPVHRFLEYYSPRLD